jgi:hypothetical protein
VSTAGLKALTKADGTIAGSPILTGQPEVEPVRRA